MIASPQIQNGYTKLANELLVALYRYPFSGNARRVVDWVIRDSYGWERKKTTAASFSDLEAELIMSRASVGFAVKGLIAAGIILRDTAGCYALNKHYRDWIQQAPSMLPLTGAPNQKAKAALAEAPPPRVRKDRPTPAPTPAPALASPAPAFVAPTLEQVAAYCVERGGKINPERWHTHYCANGWRVGRNAMTDWQAAVRSWETNGVGGNGANGSGKKCPICTTRAIEGNAVVCENCMRCKKCGTATPNLKIGKRPDGSCTAWCRDCVNVKNKPQGEHAHDHHRR